MPDPPYYNRPGERDTEEQQMEAKTHARRLALEEERRQTAEKKFGNRVFTIFICIITGAAFLFIVSRAF